MKYPGWLTRALTHIIPSSYLRDAEQAEERAQQARQELDAVEERGRRVNRIAAALQADRLENHYAERVRAAYAGKEHP